MQQSPRAKVIKCYVNEVQQVNGATRCNILLLLNLSPRPVTLIATVSYAHYINRWRYIKSRIWVRKTQNPADESNKFMLVSDLQRHWPMYAVRKLPN